MNFLSSVLFGSEGKYEILGTQISYEGIPQETLDILFQPIRSDKVTKAFSQGMKAFFQFRFLGIITFSFPIAFIQGIHQLALYKLLTGNSASVLVITNTLGISTLSPREEKTQPSLLYRIAKQFFCYHLYAVSMPPIAALIGKTAFFPLAAVIHTIALFRFTLWALDTLSPFILLDEQSHFNEVWTNYGILPALGMPITEAAMIALSYTIAWKI